MAKMQFEKETLDVIRTEKELIKIVVSITDEILKEDLRVLNALRKLQSMKGDTIEVLAGSAEYKIRREQMKRVKEIINKILKGSTNRMIVATIKVDGN